MKDYASCLYSELLTIEQVIGSAAWFAKIDLRQAWSPLGEAMGMSWSRSVRVFTIMYYIECLISKKKAESREGL